MRGYIPPKDDAEKMLFRRIQDLARRAAARGDTSFSAFLNEREEELAEAALHTAGTVYASFYGGQEDTERKMLGLSADTPPEKQDFPIKAISIHCRGAQSLTHRDFLGALVGLGLSRDTIGDIYVSDGENAICYVTSVAAAAAQQELTSVGRYTAEVELLPDGSTAGQSFSPQKTGAFFVSSPRLDTVLANTVKVGRSEAQSMLRRSLVQVNHMLVTDVSFYVQDGDVLSVRGFGKYKIQCAGATSKKGRLRMEWMQY